MTIPRVSAEIRARLEEIARLWPVLSAPSARLDVLYSGGRVRRAYVHVGPVRPAELGRVEGEDEEHLSR